VASPNRSDAIGRRECDDGAVTARHLPPPVPVTVLRVYEPLEAFAADERATLAALADDPEAGRAAERAERLASWLALLRLRGGSSPSGPPGRGAVEVDRASGGDAGGAGVRTGDLVHARVLRAQGMVLLAPVLADAAGGPGPGAGAVTGPRSGRGTRDLDRRHTLVRAWDVPVAWLVLARPEDLTRSGGPGRYVLPMSRARVRAARALRTLRSGLGETEVTEEVEELARWLEQFHPRSWAELDARPVAALVDGEDGAEDVRLGLECLAAGDAAGVAAAYQRVSRRSHRLEQLSVSS
jgi:hypothetical protein